MSAERRLQTLLASIGVNEDDAYGAVAPALHLSTTYAWPGSSTKPKHDYARSGHPTARQLERLLAALEGGAGAVATNSGMAAIALVLNLLDAGDRIICGHDAYGGTQRLFASYAKRGRAAVTFVDQSDPAAVDRALAERPKLVWIETPSNPVMRIVDVAALAEKARAAGALSAADNTFMTPLRQRPLELGCDLVVHSTTKFINGHTDVIGGAVIAASTALHDELLWWANNVGCTSAPFDAYQILRGARTLGVRLDRQEATANALAEALQGAPGVLAVHYPGLERHPGRALAERQQSGFGAMLSFEVAGGAAGADSVLGGMDLITTAASLGGYETLACRPATMTHASIDAETRAAAGVVDGLIRLSVGLEHPDDLIADLERGLARLGA